MVYVSPRPLKRVPTLATRRRLANDPNVPICTQPSHFGGPQCRFCDHSVYDQPKTRFHKYGVRHYCCDECRRVILEMAR